MYPDISNTNPSSCGKHPTQTSFLLNSLLRICPTTPNYYNPNQQTLLFSYHHLSSQTKNLLLWKITNSLHWDHVSAPFGGMPFWLLQGWRQVQHPKSPKDCFPAPWKLGENWTLMSLMESVPEKKWVLWPNWLLNMYHNDLVILLWDIVLNCTIWLYYIV